MKWTRHLCHVALSTRSIAAFRASCASEITGLTPTRPRLVKVRRKAVQNGSASDGSADVTLNSLARRRDPDPPTTIMTPKALRLRPPTAPDTIA